MEMNKVPIFTWLWRLLSGASVIIAIFSFFYMPIWTDLTTAPAWGRKQFADHYVIVTMLIVCVIFICVWFVGTAPVRNLYAIVFYEKDSNRGALAFRDFNKLVLAARGWPTMRAARIYAEIRILGLSHDGIFRKAVQQDRLARKKMAKAPALDLTNCQTLRRESELDMIISYLDYVNSHPSILEHKDRFICAIRINSGFVAPIFLITGLLVAAADEWSLVIEKFGTQVRDQSSVARNISDRHYSYYSRRLAAFRLFQFNCWLLWGPSVPVCSCNRWKSRKLVLQFGFGDENNSIDVLVPGNGASDYNEIERYKDSVDRLLSSRPSEGPHRNTLEKPHSAHAGSGRVVGFVKRPKVDMSEFCAAQKDLLCKDLQDLAGKPIPNKRLSLELADIEDLQQASPDSEDAVYYSSYIWMMFTLGKLKEVQDKDKPFELVFKDDNQRWQNLLPFFVHGNIAEADSYLQYKKALASQAWEVIKSLARDDENKEIAFNFVCAFDETRCGSTAYFTASRGDPMTPGEPFLIRDIFLKIVNADDEKLLGARVFVPSREANEKDNDDDPYTSCRLPHIISDYYARNGFWSPA